MDDEEIEVGLTGARFGSPSTRKRLRKQRHRPEPAVQPEPEPEHELPALTGARFGPPSLRKRLREQPEPEPEPVPEPDPEPTVVLDLDPEWPVFEERGALVRPYARTGGRTTAAIDLGLETLISADEHRFHFATSEQLPMVRLCMQPRSVAEIAALSDVPLGVARILLSDLIGAGLVAVHEREAPDMGLLERVLAGLHRL
ncbi:hypothetical protein Lesp02_55850 [Lentzea sp. NBRC 105346]|uniref:DUF742 domain-containing protein n=1 Tax=Lentzea sp. NBRC 105346 TaxID=3032205 RepID=UPI0024A527D9|nr:DUF742 domain-containing protein [Lentzea sp. NBRC 105346]GLZ33397.1 hypothetical protein Lesp02_55850 [Lentzea sp. NBRC 105346]